MKRLNCFAGILVAGALAASAPNSAATSLVEMSVQQLTQASSVIVRGHAVNQVTQWNPSHTGIETLTTLVVDQAMKGQPPATVVVRQPGGMIGRYRVYVPGTVRFLPSAAYVLFLEPSQEISSQYLLVGMMEGAYRIFRDAKTGEERVINPAGKYFYASRRTAASMRSDAPSLPLRQFQEQVANALVTPVVIPGGTAIPLQVESATFDGVGRIALQARTVQDLFPNRLVAVPAGSLVTGYAARVGDHWVLRWTILELRGAAVKIRVRPQTVRNGSFKGERLVVVVE